MKDSPKGMDNTKIFLHLWCVSRVSRSIFGVPLHFIHFKANSCDTNNICCGFCWPNSFVWLLHHLNPQTLDSFGTHDIKSLEVPLRQKGCNTMSYLYTLCVMICLRANINVKVQHILRSSVSRSSASFFRRVGSILTWIHYHPLSTSCWGLKLPPTQERLEKRLHISWYKVILSLALKDLMAPAVTSQWV